MVSGTTVTVSRPTVASTDPYGNPVFGWTTETVDNVLVSPGATADLEASRPQGASVAFTLQFPKGYDSSLEGCTVTLPDPWGGTYRVVGDPRPYMDANCPTAWHMQAEVEAAHG